MPTGCAAKSLPCSRQNPHHTRWSLCQVDRVANFSHSRCKLSMSTKGWCNGKSVRGHKFQSSIIVFTPSGGTKRRKYSNFDVEYRGFESIFLAPAMRYTTPRVTALYICVAPSAQPSMKMDLTLLRLRRLSAVLLLPLLPFPTFSASGVKGERRRRSNLWHKVLRWCITLARESQKHPPARLRPAHWSQSSHQNVPAHA